MFEFRQRLKGTPRGTYDTRTSRDPLCNQASKLRLGRRSVLQIADVFDDDDIGTAEPTRDLTARVVADGFDQFRHDVAYRQNRVASTSCRGNIRRQLLDELGLPDTSGSEDEQKGWLCRGFGGECSRNSDRVRMTTNSDHLVYRFGPRRG